MEYYTNKNGSKVEIIGAWMVTTSDGEVWFTDRTKGELLETAIASANATFGDGCTVKKA